MKLVTFVDAQRRIPRLGVHVNAQDILDVADADQLLGGHDSTPFASMQALIEAGPVALDRVRQVLAKGPNEAVHRLDDGARLLAPLPLPVQIRDCMCFEGHLIGSTQASMRMAGLDKPTERHLGMQQVFDERPIYYKANRFAVTGTDTDVVWPSYSQLMDYELEMGCVLGKQGRDIPLSQARDHIFGYTIFNDFSARDTQGFEMLSSLGPSKSKDFDNANAIGPCIVTADALDPYKLAMTVRVNGEVRSEGTSASITYTFEDLIHFISTSETLHPGEILGSGTVGGGCGLEQGTLLKDGDVVELEIEGIGVLRNRVLAPHLKQQGTNP